MGVWGNKPWDGDGSADWFGNLMAATKLADHVEKTLNKKDLDEYWEEVRAAAYLVVLLGRVYIWPIDKLRPHLALAIQKLEAIQQLEDIQGGDIATEIDGELAILRERLALLPAK